MPIDGKGIAYSEPHWQQEEPVELTSLSKPAESALSTRVPINTSGDLVLLESWIRHHSRTEPSMPCGATQTMAFAEIRHECLRRLAMHAAGAPVSDSYVRYLLGHLRISVEPDPAGQAIVTCLIQTHPKPKAENKKRTHDSITVQTQ